MSIDLSQFIPSFLEESFEGLELMESSLLTLEPGDNETIHSIFRAAHSIKGGAGTFGFNKVTEFTHLVETLLDEMRDGRREITQTDIEILLDSVDCMRLLIETSRDGEDCHDEKIPQTSASLAKTLANETSVATTDIDNNEVKSNDYDNDSTNKIDAPHQWHISFLPEHQLVQTGNDPLLLFKALTEFGTLAVQANTDQLPPLTEMNAEELFISWQLTLNSECSKDDIVEIFEWVEDECELIVTETEQEIKENTAEQIKPNLLASNKDDSFITDNTDVPDVNLDAQNNANIANNSIQTLKDEDIADTATKVPTKKTDVGSIRVGVDKVDSLINLVGELVITQSMLSELGNDFNESKVERLTLGLEQLLQNTKELQESVMRIRMLPISFAFNRFPRLIHDLSKKTGKSIELIIKGEQTELDKTVMEQIGDPLVHLVRNAVDHGIEPTEVRLANGKPEQGTITLDAYHLGGNIVIEINDDGGGINRQAVLHKAIEKGIVEPNATLTDNQVFDLLFEPGFSTAKEVSDISGRGVGMDVVKRNIQSLGGRIQVESEQGIGSTFKVNLPLTLAILDGQLVRVGSQVYIIPLIAIVESLQVQRESINRVSGDMNLYRLRDENVPILSIYQLFNIEAINTDLSNALLVVVEADGQKVGLMVDDLLAQQQVVIKSLKDNYQQVDGISGATILGDGSVSMILDVPGLINIALNKAQKNQQLLEQELV